MKFATCTPPWPPPTRCRVGLDAQRRGRLVGLGGRVGDVAADQHAEEEGGRGRPTSAGAAQLAGLGVPRRARLSLARCARLLPYPQSVRAVRAAHVSVPGYSSDPAVARSGRRAGRPVLHDRISAFGRMLAAVRPRPARIPDATRPSEPIFILGMLRRSGTNYLSDLLVQHPDCVSAAPVHEDHLVQRAGHSLRYVDAVTGSGRVLGRAAGERARLLRSLGAGIVTTSKRRAPAAIGWSRRRPALENLDRYFDLFPSVPLLLLVRDGRNVVASNVRSFDVNEEAARQEWASAGRAILEFDARNRGRGLPYRIVRYEDLLDDLESTMTEVLRCCGLDPDRLRPRRGAGAPAARFVDGAPRRCRRALGARREGRRLPAERTLARLDAVSARPVRGGRGRCPARAGLRRSNPRRDRPPRTGCTGASTTRRGCCAGSGAASGRCARDASPHGVRSDPSVETSYPGRHIGASSRAVREARMTKYWQRPTFRS